MNRRPPELPTPFHKPPHYTILALARVLSRPSATVYRVVSNSDPTKGYTLTFEANEVTCTCPGFGYRGIR